MERIITYTIGPDAAGWSILRFLQEKHYSRAVIIQLKKTKNGILLNREWAYVNQMLKEGDILYIRLLEPEETDPGLSGKQPAPAAALYQKQNILPARLPAAAVYEDEDLLVVKKPSGMPIHPSMGHSSNTLANAVCCHALQRQEFYPYRCINRLDRDTSGLTIIAKNAYSSCILYEQMRERRIRRIYYAIAQGRMPPEGTINAPIARKEGSIIARTVDFSAGEPAVTHFQTLACKNGISFVKAWLDTGRTHQIRVHFSYIGHPLLGDFLYHPTDSRMERQALHAGELSFWHPVSGQELTFFAPLPDDMRKILQMAGLGRGCG